MRKRIYALAIALALCIMGVCANDAQARWYRHGWGRGYGGYGFYGYRGWGYPAYYGGYYRPWGYGYGYRYPGYYGGSGIYIGTPGFALSIGRPYYGGYGYYPRAYWW
jgi:hypothetical protein